MPTKKIAEPKYSWCKSPDHEVPSHQVFSNGVYEHICSGCGRKITFVVENPTW